MARTITLAEHPILQGGLGTRNRMAALRKVLREAAPDMQVLPILNAALIAYESANKTDARTDAPANGSRDENPSDTEQDATAHATGKVGKDAPRKAGRPKGSKDKHPRKRRADAGKSRKPAADIGKHTPALRKCMACDGIARANGTAWIDGDESMPIAEYAAEKRTDAEYFTCAECDAL